MFSRYPFHILLCITVLCSLMACDATKPDVPLRIEHCEPMPYPRASAACFVIDDKAYVFGGRDSCESYLNDLWVFDSKHNTWSNKGTTPLSPRVNAIACVHEGMAYIGLGFNGKYNNKDSYFRDWWAYDPEQNTWTALASYPDYTTSKTIALVGKGELYVGYGFYWAYERDMYRYDIDSDQWQLIDVHLDRKALTYPLRCFGSVGATCQDRHFAGTGFRVRSLNQWSEFDPSGEWIRKKAVPGMTRTTAACTATSHYVYVAGGMHFGGVNTDGKILSDIQRYNPQTDDWQCVGILPDGGRTNHIAFTIGNKVYIGLGENEQYQVCNQLYMIHEE